MGCGAVFIWVLKLDSACGTGITSEPEEQSPPTGLAQVSEPRPHRGYGLASTLARRVARKRLEHEIEPPCASAPGDSCKALRNG
jgi:hypothetical protein